uniref:taste receptor type 2 member 3 n=1 Tax=Jaculus jaculus TaxID=51337 RepID=UPI001E1B2B4A|nr:taste receptor type 2 member 3 [Jaculus jaculus]
MVGPVEGVFLILIVAQFILGNLGNVFIVLVNGGGWLKSKKMSLPDFIITSVALSRIILLWIILIDGLLIVFSYDQHSWGTGMQLIDIFWTFTNHLSIWFITSLGVLYCLKISSFSHPAFLWLKWRASLAVVWMLRGSLLIACASTLSLMNEFKIYSALLEISTTGNVTEPLGWDRSEYDLFHVLGNLWKLPALILSLAAYFLLLLSLGRHTQHMGHHGAGTGDRNTEAHRRALRIIFSFLVTLLLYLLSFIIVSVSRFLPSVKMAKMIGEVILMLYPSGHSFILILGTKKLKQTFVAMLPYECGHLNSGSEQTLSA